MKKILVMMVISIFVFSGIAVASFENKTQEEVSKQLIDFYNETKDNKLSGYAIEGLLLRINNIFRNNIVIPQPPKKDVKDDAINK